MYLLKTKRESVKVKAILFLLFSTFTTIQIQSQSAPNPNAQNIYEFYEQFGDLSEDDYEEGSIENRILRSQRIWLPRLYPHGDFSLAAENIYDYSKNYLPNVLDADWEEMGPIGSSGNQNSNKGIGQIHCLEFHPDYNGSSNEVIFAGSNFGGLWKSDNAGLSWEEWNTDYLPISSVSSIEISEQDPDTMFISTGRGISGMSSTFTPNNSVPNPTYTIGIYRSKDGGLSWETINQGLMNDYESGGFIRRILANPNDANIMFAVGTQGVHRTLNALSANPVWVKVFDAEPGTENDALIGLEFKPDDPNTVYVSGLEVYKSTDNGLNWGTITGVGTGLDVSISGLPNDFVIRVINIGVTPDKPSIIIAYTQGDDTNYTDFDDDGNGISHGVAYIHRFDGNQWNEISQWDGGGDLDIINGRASIAVSPTNEKEIYVGTTKVWGTRNYDLANFAYKSGYSTTGFHADVQALEFFPDSPDKLLCGNDGGVSEKDLTSTSIYGWSSRLEGLGVSKSWGFDVSDYDVRRLMVGNQDCGTYKHAPGIFDWGVSDWLRVYGVDGYGVQFHQFNSDITFLKPNGGFARYDYSTNDDSPETTFLPNDPYINTDKVLKRVTSFRMDNHPRTGSLHLGFPEILERKIDIPMGGTLPSDVWKIRSNLGLGADGTAGTSDDLHMWQRQMLEFTIAPSDPNYMYCSNISREGPGTDLDYPLHFYRTTTGGCDGITTVPCFEEISGNLPTGTIIPDFVPVVTGIAVDPKDPEHLWVSISGYEPNIKVLESFDAGDTWSSDDPSNSLPNIPMGGIIYQQGSNGTLYMATDAGVYVKLAGETTWSKFGNIPNVRVTNLEINYCSEKLFAGTYGRGVWSVPLHNFNRKYDSYHIIEEDATWDTKIALAHNLKILDGATLTITGEVSMPSYSRIEVENGGRLIVDGGKLTNNCDIFWKGIYVAGDPNGQSLADNPGRASFINGAIVENARTAVRNYGLNDNGNIDYAKTGGVITSENAVFRNNNRDLEFISYQNVNTAGDAIADLSSFDETDFYVDDDYIGFSSIIHNVTIYRCYGIEFNGCNFFDNRSSLEPLQRRSGILARAGTVDVNEFCVTNPNPNDPPVTCDGGIPSTFTDLNDAIKIESQGNVLFLSEVKNSEFISCWRGVNVYDNDNVEVWRNEFEVTPYSGTGQGDTNWPVGIYLDKGANGYHIEENQFYPADGSTDVMSGNAVGIVAKTGHGDNEEIYRNEFRHLSVAFESLGRNRTDNAGNNEFNGLRIKCNVFEKNRTDIFMTDGGGFPDGIARDQGFATGDAAYNTFSVNSNYLNIYNTSNMAFVNYRWDQNVPLEEPMEASIIPATLDVDGIPVSISEKCPNNLDEIVELSINQKRTGSKSSMEQKQIEMAQVLDGGDTEGLQTDVALTTNTDAWHRYVQLMSKSGYITETVLEELATNESGFTQAMARDVLVANPHAAKSEEINEALDARAVPLPTYMREQIALGLTQLSAKEFLQMQKDDYKNNHDLAVRDLHHIFSKEESMQVQDYVDILSYTGDVSQDYKLVEIYDAVGQQYLGDALLNGMNSTMSLEDQPEYDRYVEFRTLIESWKNQGVKLNELGEIEISTLENYSDIDDRVGAKALSLLLINDAVEIEQPVIIPDLDKAYREINMLKPDGSLTVNGELILYPNPAEDYFTVKYFIVKTYQNAELRITNTLGIIVHNQQLRFDMDEVIVSSTDESRFQTGTYICEILLDGNSYLVETISIK